MMKKQIALWVTFLFTSCSTSDSLFDKATELENQGAYVEAIEVLNRLIKSDPLYLPAYISRGVDKTELKKWSEAIEDYSHAINCDSTYIVAWVNRGNSKIQLGDYPGALTDLKTAAQIKRQVYGDIQLLH